MPTSSNPPKKRVIVDYKNVTAKILTLFSNRYPYGYEREDIISFKNAKGETVRAVPFETPDTKYLVKISMKMDAKIEAFIDDEVKENEIGSTEYIATPETNVEED